MKARLSLLMKLVLRFKSIKNEILKTFIKLSYDLKAKSGDQTVLNFCTLQSQNEGSKSLMHHTCNRKHRVGEFPKSKSSKLRNYCLKYLSCISAEQYFCNLLQGLWFQDSHHLLDKRIFFKFPLPSSFLTHISIKSDCFKIQNIIIGGEEDE